MNDDSPGDLGLGVPNYQTQNFDETTPFLGLHLLLPARKTSFLGYLRLKMHELINVDQLLGIDFLSFTILQLLLMRYIYCIYCMMGF